MINNNRTNHVLLKQKQEKMDLTKRTNNWLHTKPNSMCDALNKAGIILKTRPSFEGVYTE